VVAEHDGEGSF